MRDEIGFHLNKVLEYIDNPSEGLPIDVFYFISQLTPLVNVDLLIKNKHGQSLLTWRHDKFYGPAWHIPGGIIRFKERIEERIEKVAQSELGVVVSFNPKPIHVQTFINNNRDVRGHFISLLFSCELKTDPALSQKFKGGDPIHGQWAWHDQAPPNLLSVHEVFRDFING